MENNNELNKEEMVKSFRKHLVGLLVTASLSLEKEKNGKYVGIGMDFSEYYEMWFSDFWQPELILADKILSEEEFKVIERFSAVLGLVFPDKKSIYANYDELLKSRKWEDVVNEAKNILEKLKEMGSDCSYIK
jgi:hypothetical protein